MKKISSLLLMSGLILMTWSHMAEAEARFERLKQLHYRSPDGTHISGYYMRPERRGRFPAIIALHGCSGLMLDRYEMFSHFQDWGTRFVKWGYVVIFPDSFGSRDIRSICRTRNRPVSLKDRVRDTLGARKWAMQQGFINHRDISLIGWSHGGSAVLKLAYSSSGPDFRQAFAFYPECDPILNSEAGKVRTPLTILMGRDDDWTDPRSCQEVVWSKGGHIILYDRAYHGFDLPNVRLHTRLWIAYTKRGDGVVHVGTNHKARNQSIDDVRRLLSLR